MIFPGKQVALNRVGSKEISTVELPRLPGDEQVLYETCVFHDDDTSHVVMQYTDVKLAHISHNKIVQHELRHAVVKKQHKAAAMHVINDDVRMRLTGD